MRLLQKTREETCILGQGVLMRFEIKLPQAVKWILGELNKNGYEAYAVGGCVRDAMLGREPQDWDITTNARPDQVKEIFHRTADTGIAHGTVTVLVEHTGYEVTTYRIDGEYEDGRHPKKVSYTSDLREDLKRRDFTINAMAYSEKDGLIDAFDGVLDLRRGIVRCVGTAAERFSEDALRMLRALRFAAQLGFVIEEQTRSAVCELAANLNMVSAERIQAELTKLLLSDHPEEMKEVYRTGISSVILPEWDRMMETRQNNPHHCHTVGEHTIHVMRNVPKEKALRYAALLHDVGKPECRTTDEDGVDHFCGHPAHGEKLAGMILRRLKMDNATIRAVCGLVRYHDWNPELTRKSIRRTVCLIGRDCYPQLFALKKADILAQSSYMREEKLSALARYEELYREITESGECLSLKELAVTGADLIAAGMRPGRQIGEVLRQLLDLVIEEPDRNTKEDLMEFALSNGGACDIIEESRRK